MGDTQAETISRWTDSTVAPAFEAAADLVAPVSGTVIEVNMSMLDNPGALNDDPMNDGWLIRIEMDTEKELANLMCRCELSGGLRPPLADEMKKHVCEN